MKLKYYLIAAALCAGMAGCDDKIETYETEGVTSAPVAIAASSVTTEALPGQIRLMWPAPAENAYEYLQIRYNDPLTKEEVCLIASNHATEMLIDDTRARFGDYTFAFQTFNVNGQGSTVTEVKAQSGPAPTTEQHLEVILSGDQLSTDCQEPTEGPVSNLVNNNYNDFFHARWSSPQVPMPHYVQIDFKEEHQNFTIEWWDRIVGNPDGFPTKVEILVSNDGSTWDLVDTLEGIPASSGAHVTTDVYMWDAPFRYLRLNVLEATRGSNYFHMAELKFYDVEIYDPETAPLE